jgi:hypothetical protein
MLHLLHLSVLVLFQRLDSTPLLGLRMLLRAWRGSQRLGLLEWISM